MSGTITSDCWFESEREWDCASLIARNELESPPLFRSLPLQPLLLLLLIDNEDVESESVGAADVFGMDREDEAEAAEAKKA